VAAIVKSRPLEAHFDLLETLQFGYDLCQFGGHLVFNRVPYLLHRARIVKQIGLVFLEIYVVLEPRRWGLVELMQHLDAVIHPSTELLGHACLAELVSHL
jgi:hypothetical protein